MDSIASRRICRAWTMFSTCAGRNRSPIAQVRLAEEQQFSAYSFDHADAAATRKQFDIAEAEAVRLLAANISKLKGATRERFPVLQAYDMTLKCSHFFNLLDARGAISVTERAAMIGRVRKLATQVAKAWLEQQRPRPPRKRPLR